jgi:L-amino acid N-acyltransferase YncA
MRIRDATDADVPAILTIYNDVVTNTTAIYDERPSTLEERQAWFDGRRSKNFPVLVGELNGEVVGFSTFGEWRSRWGYRYTVEHSVHVRADCRGKGFGRKLIEVLFPHAREIRVQDGGDVPRSGAVAGGVVECGGGAAGVVTHQPTAWPSFIRNPGISV